MYNIIKDTIQAQQYKMSMIGKNNIFMDKILIIKSIVSQSIPGRVEIPHMGIRVTNKCSLQCKYCADLIPYYKKKENIDYKEIIKDINLLINSVDYIHELLIIGGETFLHPDLYKIIRYCVRIKKISSIILTTNGTIVPNSKLLNELRKGKNKIIVRVSNYGNITPKRQEIISKLKKYQIRVDDLRMQRWGNIGDFRKRNRNSAQLKEVYNNCSMRFCHTLMNGTVYICGRQNGAEIGLIPKVKEKEKFNIRNKSKREIRYGIKNLYKLEYLSTCDYCDGLNKKTPKIAAGEQIK